MALALDDRRRAMLQEMGLRVWTPSVSPLPGPDAVLPGPRGPSGAVDDRPARRCGASAPAPARAIGCVRPDARACRERARAGEPAGPASGVDWPSLVAQVSRLLRLRALPGRRAVVIQPEPAPRQTDWLIVGEAPDADESAGTPFAGDAGRLLDNMLRAVGVRRDGLGSGCARATPCAVVPPCPAIPEPAELAACAGHLWQEIAWTQPRVVLAMGRFAAQTLLADLGAEQAAQPLGRLRGRLHHVRGVAVVVTHHPSRLLRAPADKAQAWVDLCLARAVALGQDP